LFVSRSGCEPRTSHRNAIERFIVLHECDFDGAATAAAAFIVTHSLIGAISTALVSIANAIHGLKIPEASRIAISDANQISSCSIANSRDSCSDPHVVGDDGVKSEIATQRLISTG
jgi:hypothetical protein